MDFKAQVQAAEVRNITIEKEVSDRAKNTEDRLRARCSRFSQTISELKATAHKSDCEVVEQRKITEELTTRISGCNSRIALMEQDEISRRSEIARLQDLLRESSTSLAKYGVELAEKDRAIGRSQSTIYDLQSKLRSREDQRVGQERQVQEAEQETAHARALLQSANHQADDIVSRAKEGERKAQRDLAAERYRSEVAVNEANERCAEMQRKLQKEIIEERHRSEEEKHSLAIELSESRRAMDSLKNRTSKGLNEARSTASEALNRVELQLEDACKRAEKFENLYSKVVAKNRCGCNKESAQQLSLLKAEIQGLRAEQVASSQRIAQLEGENRQLNADIVLGIQDRSQMLSTQQQLERRLISADKDTAAKDLLCVRVSEMRQQISEAQGMLEKASYFCQ